MQELTLNEVQDVNGGVAFLIPVVQIAFSVASGAAGAYALGEALGSLAKQR